MKKAQHYYLFGALLVGLLARTPGIFWGYNFPTKWVTHHVDEWTHIVNAETMINPQQPPRWNPHPYPRGMAAHVAVPMMVFRALKGNLFEKTPSVQSIFITGRVISVLYGTVTILIVFLLAGRLFRDPRVALLAAWIIALGGLHVSQSHFFLSDVSSIFWFLLGSYLLFLDFGKPNESDAVFLMAAAACFGVSFGLKLTIFSLPTLALITLISRPRLIRSVQAATCFLAGFILVNFASYTPYDIARTFFKASGHPYQFSWWSSLVLYLVELPSVVSFPIVLLFLGGSYFLVKKLSAIRADGRFLPIFIIIIIPLFIYGVLIISRVSHFPRHLILFIPWISMIVAWSLVKIMDKARFKGLHPSLVIVPFFVYLAIFVYDGEKVFIKEPRNEAANWLYQNVALGTDISWIYHGEDWVPGYNHVFFPDRGKPLVLVMEMLFSNHFLSGMGLKNSYPTDYRFIFDGRSQERVNAIQSLFKGTSEYEEVARFSEGYFMSEYLLVNNLLGDRSRNYVTEIVIFMKKADITER